MRLLGRLLLSESHTGVIHDTSQATGLDWMSVSLSLCLVLPAVPGGKRGSQSPSAHGNMRYQSTLLPLVLTTETQSGHQATCIRSSSLFQIGIQLMCGLAVAPKCLFDVRITRSRGKFHPCVNSSRARGSALATALAFRM